MSHSSLTGINCELCIPRHYRPMEIRQDAESPCVPCGCFINGITRNERTGLVGDCVMNNDTGRLPINQHGKAMVR